jgi:hypothetical protein
MHYNLKQPHRKKKGFPRTGGLKPFVHAAKIAAREATRRRK